MGLVDPFQPDRAVPKNNLNRSLPTISHPQKTKPNQSKDEDYYSKKLEKYDFANNKNNIGKNCCDSFWWVLVSAIIFAIGAYVSKHLLMSWPYFKSNPKYYY